MIPKFTQEVWRGAGGILAAESLSLPAGLMISAMLTRALAADGYGHYALAVAIVGGIQWLIASAFNRLAVQTLSREPQHLPTFLRYYAVTGVACLLGLLALAPTLATQLHVPELRTSLRWLAWDIPLFAFAQAQRTFLIANGQYSRRAVSGGSRWIVRAAATWLALELNLGIPGVMLSWILASLTELLLLRATPLSALLLPGASAPLPWRAALPLFLFAASQRIFERVDLLLLQSSGVAPSQTGLYAAAQNLAILPALMAGSLSPVLISALIRGERAGQAKEAQHAAHLSLCLTLAMLPISGFYFGWGDDFAGLLFGAPFRPAGKIAGLLTASAIGVALNASCVSVLAAAGDAHLSWRYGLPSLVLTLVLLSYAIPRYGLMGAAVASAFSGLVPALIGLWFVYRRWQRPFPLGTLAACVAVAAALYLIGGR